MFSATFIFEKRQFDERFYRLDEEIAAFARQTTGYVGEDAWGKLAERAYLHCVLLDGDDWVA